MISRTTWVLLAIFGVLLAVFYFSQRSDGKEVVEVSPTVALDFLLDLTEAQIEKLDIEDAAGNSVSIRREAENNWVLDGLDSEAVDQARIASGVRQLTTLRLLSELEGVQDFTVYGLTDPAYNLTVATVDGFEWRIAIGDATPTGGGYYAQIEDQSPKVVNGVSLDAVLDLLTAPLVLPTQAATDSTDPTETPAPES